MKKERGEEFCWKQARACLERWLVEEEVVM